MNPDSLAWHDVPTAPSKHPGSLRLFRLDAGLAARSHDVDFLRSAMISAVPGLAEGPRISPEELDGLIRLPPVERPSERADDTGEIDIPGFVPGPTEKNVWFKYRGRHRAFFLTQLPAGPQLFEDRPIRLEEDGRLLFTGIVCQGTYDLPLLYARLIDNRLAFEYLDGRCENRPPWNTYYDGMNVNRAFRVHSSRQLFVYRGKIGFVAGVKGRDHLFFNGTMISPAFDCLRGYNHEEATPPLLDLHSGGLLLFGASIGQSIILGVINLNEFF